MRPPMDSALVLGNHREYCNNNISLKTRFFGLHFCCRKCQRIFNHFYVIRPESYRIRWNYAAVRLLRRSRSFKVIQGTRVWWYQSKAHMRLLSLVINSNLCLASFPRYSLRKVQNRYIWLPLLRLTPDGAVLLGRSP